METLLIDEWLPEEESLAVEDDASVALLREEVRRCGGGWLSPVLIERVALIGSELGQNQIRHTISGRMAVRRVERLGVPGLELVAADDGDGILDPTAALQGRQPTATSLGQGLALVRRQADEVDFDIRWLGGTCIRARVFAGPVSVRSEVGHLCRPFAQESVSGDDAAFVRLGDTLVVSAIDGLGHGPAAHAAAMQAARLTRQRVELPPKELLLAVNAGLKGTRGAVMAVARIDLATGEVEFASVGDVETQFITGEESQRVRGTPGVLGLAGRLARAPRVERLAARPGDLLVMYSDGLLSGTTLTDAPEMWHRHPIEIAQYLLQRFERRTDDASVLVVRL